MAQRDSNLRSVAKEDFIYEHRLAGFNATGGKRTSTGARAPKWPHKNPSAEQVAKAGFIFDPNPEHPDNVTCYTCTKALTGWCEDDDPILEHVKHSENCGWAIAAAIEAHLPGWEDKNPMSEEMLQARKNTFGEWWPYEKKKGWKCKVKQLAEAGWHFEPTFESDDMAKCAYCGLALDGWEAGDKPYDEHYKRAPHCKFFELCQRFPPVKKSRAKAASKASRLSTQSVATIATVASDLASAADITADHDDTVLTTTSVMTQGGRKAPKARKAPAKGRKTKAKKEEENVEILEDAPQEPENLAPPPPAKPARGRKRASDAMEDSVVTNAETPAPKKRATRKKGSAAVDTSIMTTASQDTEMVDAPVPKKAPAKKRATKATRKTSQTSVRSQASTASLRTAAVDDEEIERQLQADLERPLTDDEDIAADSDSEKQKKPKSTARGRPKKATGTRKASAQSQAPPSTDYQMFDPTPSEPNDAEIEAEYQKMEAEAGAEKQELEEAPLVVPKKGRKTAGTRKASKQTKKTKEPASAPADVDEEDPLGDITPVPIPAPVRKEEELPELDPDASTGTVVSQPIKRGRGRPSKKSLLAQAAAEEAEKRRSSGLSAEIEMPKMPEMPLEPTRDRESFSVIGAETSPVREEITRKPVPRPGTSSSSVRPATSSSSIRPPTSSSAAPVPTPPTPARLDKALPPPPLESARRLPQPPATPRAGPTPSANAKQATISPSQSPQSSDAENQPPSSKPTIDTPKRVVLAPVVSTPSAGSPSKRNVVAGLQSTTPWKAVDLDAVFSPGESGDKENGIDRLLRMGGELTSPEKRMTVEEWIYFNAEVAEEKFRHECEMIVSTFENEGSRAVRVLEGIIVD
ncbi:hypothetical protein V8F20_006159 [Naviculisporaceae sp. PSN 640]